MTIIQSRGFVMADDYFPFNEGMPTGPDVEVIVKAFPELKPGDLVRCGEIYSLLKLSPESSRSQTRMRTVMAAFKRQFERETLNVILYDKDEKGYRVALPADVIKRSGPAFNSIKRKARKQRKNFNAVARIASEFERPVIEHQSRLFHAIEAHSRKAGRSLLPPTTAPLMPQISPPESKAEQI
jgi:hypothetical protein